MLTSESVLNLACSCFYGETPDPLPDDAICVSAITLTVVFDPVKVQHAKPQILSLLQELDPAFLEPEGASFLQLPFTQTGQHWGEHRDAEILMILGMAAGFVRVTPRPFWRFCPGRLPMLIVDPKGGQPVLTCGTMTMTQMAMAVLAGLNKTPEA